MLVQDCDSEQSRERERSLVIVYSSAIASVSAFRISFFKFIACLSVYDRLRGQERGPGITRLLRAVLR